MGPGDDAAVLADGTAVTVDALAEGIHWDARLSPEDVGYKAVAVNVSDLAAMGARPTWMLLALSLPRPLDRAWAEAFARGLGAAARRWSVPLIGGDVTGSTGPRHVSITMAGACVAEPMLRGGGRPGDALWVTGALGQAVAGWATAEPSPEALLALRRPEPPVAFALALAGSGLATSAMDLSDGLASDLPRLCAASRTGAVVDPGAVPVGAGATRALALAGGEDYQLLFTSRGDPTRLAAAHGVRVTRIGALTAGDAVALTTGGWPTPAFAHWEAA